MLYATVSVNTPLGPASDADPLGRTFTYRVPERLAGRLAPGHLVWATFRGRRLQAIVLELSDAAPPFSVQEIQALVWAQPLLTAPQLALARWISETYLAPLIEALRLMLPAGLTQRGRTIFVRSAAAAPADLSGTQAALLTHIATTPGDWAEVSAGIRGVTQRADLEPLLAGGLVTQETEFPTPPPRAKTDRRVRLLADAAAVARALPTLGHASKQADVLVRMGEAANQRINESADRRCAEDADSPIRPFAIRLDVLCAVAGCGEGPVRALEQRGWLTITRAGPREPALVSPALGDAALLDAIVELRGAEKQRAVLAALAGHDGSPWIGWVYAETGATLDTLRDLEAAGLITIAEEMVWRDPLAGQEFTPDQPPELTEDQARVWAVIERRICESTNLRINESARQQIGKSANGQMADGQAGGLAEGLEGAAPNPQSPIPNPQSPTFLLHGVTGSGKTEIYLRAIGEVLRGGRQAVVLVPEIALTPQTIRRFAARYGGQVTVWHSELSDGERFDVWRRVRSGHAAAQVVVGSRSALMLPFPNLGLIVLDEEHEPSYKQERTPRYHARAVALALGRLCDAAVILGSATPALETFYAARHGDIELLTLSRRILGHREDVGVRAGRAKREAAAAAPCLPLVISDELPPVQIVDLRQELRAGNRSIFSRALSAEMARVLAARQQVILYLNRRGAATFVLCRDCGYVAACDRCATPLTYHGALSVKPNAGTPAAPAAPTAQLVCHHCNRRSPTPSVCPKCQSRRIRFFGAGTEVVEEAIQAEFPHVRTLRWDRDVTGAKGSHDAILSKFTAHEADVLIGTQMIAKGLDLPLVTLVGVIAADVGLFLPDFRAGERSFQLLTQVAGRAGRSALGGRVIVQTYHPDHYAVIAAGQHDYESFYRQEMVFRREQNYPPLARLARLICYHTQRDKAQAEATRLADLLRGEIAKRGLADTDLIGPAPCFFAQERGQFRWHIVVRGPDPTAALRGLAIPPTWRVDVDPVDLL